MSQPANLAAALVAAQSLIAGVGKDATNEYQRYKYASAEAIIAAGRDALSACGLAVIPVDAQLNDTDAAAPQLMRTYAVIHESGEDRVCSQTWPVVEGKGRPIDKAYAGALTSSFAYFLRDLLCMDRVDPSDDDLHRRDEAEAPIVIAMRDARRAGTWSTAELVALLGAVSGGKCNRASKLNADQSAAAVQTIESKAGADWAAENQSQKGKDEDK